MNCPRCQINLHSATYENVDTDTCSKCGGIWLDAGELQPILMARDVIFSPALVEEYLKEAHKSIPQAEQDTLLACPICGANMHPLNYNYSSGVILNSCPQGHGLWFDKTELERVQVYMEHWDEEKNNSKWHKLKEQTYKSEIQRLNMIENADKKTGTIDKIVNTIVNLLAGKDNV